MTDLNRSAPFDSNLSLDGSALSDDSGTMISQPYQLHVERTDKAKNMSRFYTMEIQPTLFGEVSLTRRWGRIGTSGQRMICQFEREQDAVVLFLALARQKKQRGYC